MYANDEKFFEYPFNTKDENEKNIIEDIEKTIYKTLPFNEDSSFIGLTFKQMKIKDQIYIIAKLDNVEFPVKNPNVYTCITYLQRFTIIASFCILYNHIVIEDSFFTLEIYNGWQEKFYDQFLTFKLINDKFFLHKYSEERGYFPIKYNEKGEIEFEEPIEHTNIFTGVNIQSP